MKTDSRRDELAQRIGVPADQVDEFILNNVEHLSQREMDAVTHQFGVCGKQRLTLEAVAAPWNAGRERARQMRERGLHMLRRLASAAAASDIDPIEQTIETFFNPVRVKACNATHEIVAILNCFRNEYGEWDGDRRCYKPVKVRAVVNGGRRRIMRAPNMGRKRCDMIAAMLASAGLEFPREESQP